jgi:integrase/recombinase XerD
VFLSKGITPLTYNGLKLLIARLGSRAGIEGLHPHQFRHSFAVAYLMDGGDEVSLQRIMGHTSFATTQLYLKLSGKNIKEQHAKHSRVDLRWTDLSRHESGLD